MKSALLIMLALCAAAEEGAFAKGDCIGMVARDDVVLELWRPATAAKARAMFTNRNELPVRVTYVVGDSALHVIEYEAKLDGKEAVPFADAPEVEVGGQLRPDVRIVSVAKVPIEEASGYVLIAQDLEGAVGVMLFRPATGGNRVYAVVANSSRMPMTATWRATGLTEAPPLTHTIIAPAHTTLGRDGSIQLEYHPVADPRDFEQVRVRILSVLKTP